jgi:exodeoxyribonuclease-1
MDVTFYFYDLETSGLNPRSQRIMQFAGQRTTLDLRPIGEPDDYLIQLTNDILPDPDAILVTGITPQRTRAEGYSEKEFLDIFFESIATENTIFVGYNSIRFDDEFMRTLLYRNLYDPYEWQWQGGRSKWDLLDVVRMTRALRPEGIVWPFASNGAKANKLELITAVNNLEHTHAHNAMSDVIASIEVAKLIHKNQPKLFTYLLEMRDKNKVKSLVCSGAPFAYTSGRYSSDYEKTAIVMSLGGSDPASCPVYDLRIDPEEWIKTYDPNDKEQYHPIKLLKYNHCPAVAPLGVLGEEGWTTVGLSSQDAESRYQKVLQMKEQLLHTFVPRVYASESSSLLELPLDDVDHRIYDGFVPAKDKKHLARVHTMTLDELIDFKPDFEDPRLSSLLFLYKARQVPGSLLSEDREVYEQYVAKKLLDGGDDSQYAQFMSRLNELAKLDYLDADKRFVLEELALYAQSIVPLDSF